MENQEQNLTPFNIGDVLKLKSDSPKMTVYKISFNEVYLKYWDEAKKSFEQNSFDMELLERVVEVKE
jgi:uncharacterized protein YodC (DUF2158 family)